MSLNANLRLPGAVFYGTGALENIAVLANGHKHAAVFTDEGVMAAGGLQAPLAKLAQAGVESQIMPPVPPEPTAGQAQQILDAFVAGKADFIVAVGGGSVIDAAKLASAANGNTVYNLVDNPSLAKKGTPMVAIPTTAGTGAEATPNAIVALPEQAVKVGIVNFEMLPDAVILDPTMTATLPQKVAASTGVDALCHAIECYTSAKATPFSDMFALEALRLIFRHLLPACLEGEEAARGSMLLASFYAGVAIAASGTTAVHALSYPLGGRYHIPHGAANAMLLMPVMRFNATACQKRLAQVYDAVGPAGATAEEEEKAAWVVEEMGRMVEALSIPTGLAAYGIGKEDLDELVRAGMAVQRLLVNNPRPVNAADARSIYLTLL